MSSDPIVTTDTQPQLLNHQQQQQQPQQSSAPAVNTSTSTNTNINTTPTTPTNTASMDLATADQPKKAKRKRITTEQLEHLVGLFEKTDTPSFEIRESLAKKLGMSNREIQVRKRDSQPLSGWMKVEQIGRVELNSRRSSIYRDLSSIHVFVSAVLGAALTSPNPYCKLGLVPEQESQGK